MVSYSSQTQPLNLCFNFKFQVYVNSKLVAGVSKVTGLKRGIETVEFRRGGDPSMIYRHPGRVKWEPVTLERGVSPLQDFRLLAGLVWNFNGGLGSESSLANFRQDMRIEVLNNAGQTVLAYNLFRCWVSEYQALPDLDANANAVAIEHIKIEHQGFVRDMSLRVPDEPTLTTVAA